MDRIAPLPNREPGENYGFIGFNGVPEEGNYTHEQRKGNGGQKPPTLLRKETGPRVPIKLGQTSGNAGPPPTQQRPVTAEKRKSWLSRRFSKSG